MANPTFDELMADVGINDFVECSTEETKNFDKMVKNGVSLPRGILAHKYAGFTRYYRYTAQIPSEKMELYVMMRISRDLHFIRNVVLVSCILTILAVIVAPLVLRQYII